MTVMTWWWNAPLLMDGMALVGTQHAMQSPGYDAAACFISIRIYTSEYHLRG
jgi:hypothetical protein